MPGSMASIRQGSEIKKKEREAFPERSLFWFTSHCGQGRCLGYFSSAIKNSEFCSRCLVLLPAVALTRLTPPAKVNKSARNLPMISALTCLFYIQSFPSEFYAYKSDSWGCGNLLTSSVPYPAHLLKMKEIQIEKHTHTPTHPQQLDKNRVIPGKWRQQVTPIPFS